jgi:WhiB family redox-sensing transcriptional regulator
VSRPFQQAGPGPWVERAECARRGTDMAVNTNQHPRSIASRALKEICAGCPVVEECRLWALTSPDPAFMHVAGGMHPAERSAARRRGEAQ